MTIRIVSLLTLALALAPASVIAQHIDLRLNGLRIGAKYPSIVKKIGKPISDRSRGQVPCGDAMRTLRYDGLELALESSGENPFGLYRVSVTKRRWLVSGIRIGDSRRKVLSKFGRGYEQSDRGQRYLGYSIGDGASRFFFRNNRLTKVEWEFNFC